MSTETDPARDWRLRRRTVIRNLLALAQMNRRGVGYADKKRRRHAQSALANLRRERPAIAYCPPLFFWLGAVGQ